MKTQHFCGLDFGTSNSTIGIYQNGNCQLVATENRKKAMRSAIFYDFQLKKFFFGQEGIDAYFDTGHGRLMMALKSVLGSSLMYEKTAMYDKFITYVDILGYFIHHIKTIAETELQTELTQVVAGRPVKFHDQDVKKDLAAQNTLEQILRQQGFKEIIFQYEPIAAALAYEQQVTKEELALIVDMGGGTSDFTVIRLSPGNKMHDRAGDVLANNGIHIGGTDFDRYLSLKTIMPLLGFHSLMRGSSSNIEVPTSYYNDLTTWHKLNELYTNKTLHDIQQVYTVAYEKTLIQRLIHIIKNKQGHFLLETVENAKQRLSDQIEISQDLSFIEDTLAVNINRAVFNESIANCLDQLLATIRTTITLADIQPDDITAIFYTGGSTKVPLVRQTINNLLPKAKIIEGDAFGSVGLGLTINALQQFAA